MTSPVRGQRAAVGEVRDAEVGELGQAGAVLDLLGDHDVARLDVAVDDPARVRVLEGAAERQADADDVEVAERALALEVGERVAADELGDQPPRLVVVAGLVERDDPRVREPCRRERLALGARVLAAVERDALDRHRAVEALVVREPHDAEAAAAEPPDEPVAVEHQGRVPARCLEGVRLVHHVRSSPGATSLPARPGRESGADAKLASAGPPAHAVILAQTSC
jgi:hypothetical protein